MIDLTLLRTLSKGNHAFIKEILEVYLTTAPADLQLLEKMYAEKNLDQVRYLAHKMKSSAHTIGFTRGYTLFQSIEACIMNQENLDHIGPLIEKAKNLCQESFDTVNREIAKVL